MGLGSGKGMKKATYKAPPSSTSKGGMDNNTTAVSSRNSQINTATSKRQGKKLVYANKKLR
jgi:hypothetical protein